jgi:colanic acid biosynthesis glycosyl transferase WcaI
MVIEVAHTLRARTDILFVLAGEGASKATLARLIGEKRVPNVLLCPAIAGDRYAEFMESSDICLVLLSRDVPAETVPGKLADVMGRGKPVVAAVNRAGDAARIVEEAGCGFCVDPGDVEGFSAAVLRLREDEELRKSMGEKGRAFAERHFSRRVCVNHYHEVLVLAAGQLSSTEPC